MRSSCMLKSESWFAAHETFLAKGMIPIAGCECLILRTIPNAGEAALLHCSKRPERFPQFIRRAAGIESARMIDPSFLAKKRAFGIRGHTLRSVERERGEVFQLH